MFAKHFHRETAFPTNVILKSELFYIVIRDFVVLIFGSDLPNPKDAFFTSFETPH